jgi:hypothetical protein
VLGNASGSPDSPLLSDKPIGGDNEDRLGMRPLADALAYLIAYADTPLIIAVTGAWGGGKSSLARLVAGRLTDHRLGSRANVVCWFNAWMHQEAANVGTALASVVARRADRERSVIGRLLRPLPSSMRSADERFRRTVGLVVVSLSLAVGALVLSGPGIREMLVDWYGPGSSRSADLRLAVGATNASVVLLIFAAIMLSRRVFSVAQKAGDFIQRPAQEAARGGLHEVASQLGSLINQACRRRRLLRRSTRQFVIIVDDLDRCRPAQALALCDVTANLLTHPHVVIVLLCDMRALARSATTRDSTQADAPETDVADYGARYMQKLVQLELQLPVPRHDDIVSLLTERELSEESPPTGDGANLDESHNAALKPPESSRIPELPRLSRMAGAGVGVAFALAAFVLAYGYLATNWGATKIWTLVCAIVAIGYSVEVIFPGPVRLMSSWRLIFALVGLTGALAAGGVALFNESWVALPLALGSVGLSVGESARYYLGVPDTVERFDVAANQEVDELAGHQETSVDEVLARLRAIPAAKKVPSPYLWGFAFNYVYERSPYRAMALKALEPYLPTTPRGAKRMHNRLRFLLAIATWHKYIERPGIVPGLARWVALQERCPDVARAVIDEPALLPQLEEAENVGILLADKKLQPHSIDILQAVLRGKPNLSSLFEVFLNFTPESWTPDVDLLDSIEEAAP